MAFPLRPNVPQPRTKPSSGMVTAPPMQGMQGGSAINSLLQANGYQGGTSTLGPMNGMQGGMASVPSGGVGPPLMAPRLGNGGRRDEFRNVPGQQPATPFNPALGVGAGRPFGNDALPGNAGGGNGGGGGNGNWGARYGGQGPRHWGNAGNQGGGANGGLGDWNFSSDGYNIPIPVDKPISDEQAATARELAGSTRNTFDQMRDGLPMFGKMFTEGAQGAMANRADNQQQMSNEQNLQAVNLMLSTDAPEAWLQRLKTASQAGVGGADISRRLADLEGQANLLDQLRTLIGGRLLS